MNLPSFNQGPVSLLPASQRFLCKCVDPSVNSGSEKLRTKSMGLSRHPFSGKWILSDSMPYPVPEASWQCSPSVSAWLSVRTVSLFSLWAT